MSPSRHSALILHAAFLLSGATGLGYEIVWSRQFAVGLGHEYPSLLAVLAGFFAGFALGAGVFDRVISRSRRPGAWYATLELTIALWAIVSIFLIPALNDRVVHWIGQSPSAARQGGLAFIVTFFAMLPASAAMGATLPAVDRLCGRLQHHDRSVGGLYAINTFGALVGVMAATFLLAPALGFTNTLYALAASNALAALLTLTGPARRETTLTEPAQTEAARPMRPRLFLTALVTGLLGVGLEVLSVRVLAQVTEGTIYTFASVLTIFLLGTALGAALYQFLFSHRPSITRLGRLLIGLSLSFGIAGLTMSGARDIYAAAIKVFGHSVAGSVASEVVVAAAVLLLPTALMGATFSHIAQAARTLRGGIGSILSVNTLGSALAPPVIGVALIPAVGDRLTLVMLAAGYLLLVPLRRHRLGLAIAAAALLVTILPRDPLISVELASGERIIASAHGAVADADVVEVGEQKPRRLLKVNNRFQMGGTGSGEFAERRLAHIPLLLHPSPRRALFLGLGAGITFATAAEHPELQADGVELLPEVVELLPAFQPANAAIFNDPRLKVHTADARRFVRATPARYDVIVADLFHPARDGAASLYTVEHFQAIRHDLAPGGLFCQWLPLYQLDAHVLRTIVRTYLDVFPHAHAYVCHFNSNTPSLGLIAGDAPRTYPANYAIARTADQPLAGNVQTASLSDKFQLFGCFVTDAAGLRTFATSGPLNTDDRPVVAFDAPRQVYRGVEDGYPLWQALIESSGAPTFNWVTATPGSADRDEYVRRLQGYVHARNVYMTASSILAHGNETEGMARLFDAVRASPDFTVAALRVRVTAQQNAKSRPEFARQLMSRLNAAMREAGANPQGKSVDDR